MSERLPEPVDPYMYAATAAVYDWQLYDIGPFSAYRDPGLLTVSAEQVTAQGPVTRVGEDAYLLLGPQPKPNETAADALHDTHGAIACLRMDKLSEEDAPYTRLTTTPRFAFFSRLIVTGTMVAVTSPDLFSRHSHDEVWLDPERGAEAFARSFHVMTSEEYNREAR
ncbi:MAG TPA: hypothetical protein VLF62_01425 [Candidatus Saccharimonadales bacterium]|jgi:hypothetical protein|nr:hypothetical protein [Candidatus Saccharimonadales bacterium]